MPSIDERVVSMAFENARFEAGVAQTMGSLRKLDTALQTIGSRNSLSQIESAANKVTLQQPMSALDKLKARFSRAGEGASYGMNEIERAGNKVQLEQPVKALNKVQSQAAQVGRGAPEAFSELERAGSRVNFQGLHSALDSVTAKFSVMSAAAAVAFGNVATQAVHKGASWVKSFTIGPIIGGLHEYETNLKAIQTVQANTDQPLPKINKALQDLNQYSDLTIYNFGEMAKNIGTFTAAGVDLQTATSSIKGIANMAALSGSNSQQASTAMYQLSQAIASGKVGLQDWNSVVNAGMGGKKLQNALLQTGVAMGKIGKNAVQTSGPMNKLTVNGKSFRESIMAQPGKQSWLTSDILVGTLSSLDGRFSKAALSAEKTKDGLVKYTKAQVQAKIADNRAALEKKMGIKYSDEQFAALMKLSDSAFKSATEVKTLGQVFDVAKEAIGSGWSASFQSIFGNLSEAKKLFTGMSNTINGFIGANALARNKVLHDWKALGGRTTLIDGLKDGFKALFAVLKPIGQAFRDIFPRKTGADLNAMTNKFALLMHNLKPSAATVEGLRRTFRGFFAVLHIGWSIIKGFIGVIGNLLGTIGKGSGGFLNFTGGLGDFLVAVDNALTKGGLLNSFFGGLTKVLQAPISLIGKIASGIAGLFGGDGKDTKNLTDRNNELNRFGHVLTPLEKLITQVKWAWANFMHSIEGAKETFAPILEKIQSFVAKIGEAIGKAFQGENFDHLMTTLQTGFIGGIFLAIKKGITGGASDFSKTLGSVNKVLGGVTGNLKAMQDKLRAQTLFQIAASIGVLAAAVFVISKINSGDLTKAMTAIAVGLAQLIGAMKLLAGGLGAKGIAAMPFAALSIGLLAGSMILLGAAMKIMATMSWEDIAKGLVGVGGGITILSVAAKSMGPQSLLIAPAILAIALAMNLLASAVKTFGGMSWEDLGKGLVGVGAALVAILTPIGLLGPEGGLVLLGVGAGLVVVSFGLGMLAGAVAAFGSLNLETLAKGIIGSSLALIALGIAITAIPPTAALQAAGLVVLAIALNGIATSMKIFGSMSVAEIAKALIAMGGALVILAVGLTAMAGTLPGAAALLVAAGALAILAPALGFLGTLKWGTIFKGLAAIGLALGVLAIAGAAAGPGLISLGISLLPLAAGLVLVGGAVWLFAAGLSKLSSDGTKGIGVFIAAITAFVAILPKIAIDFIGGLVQILAELAKIAPDVVASLTQILDQIIQVVINSTPRLALAIGVLVDAILQVIVRDSPKLIRAGFTLFMNLLKGIDQNITQITTRVASIVTKFLSALASKMPALMAAGTRVVLAFLRGLGSRAEAIAAAAVRLISHFLAGLVSLPGRLVSFAARAITGFLRGLGSRLPDLIRAGVRVVTKFLDGVSSQFDEVANAATRFVTRFFNAFGSARNTRKMSTAGFNAAIHVLQGLTKTIHNDKAIERLIKAAADLGLAIVEGVVKGLASLPGKLGKKLIEPVGNAVDSIKGKLHINSPSRVFIAIGAGIVEGMGIGLAGMSRALHLGATAPIAQMIAANKDKKIFGKFLGGEFKQGLTGDLFKGEEKSASQTAIEGAFSALRSKLGDEQKKLRERLTADRGKLKELLGKQNKDWDAIGKLRGRIFDTKTILGKSKQATNSLLKNLADEKKQLIGLATQYEAVGKDLEAAKAHLDELKQTRDSAIASFKDQYSQLPDVDSLVSDALSRAMMTEKERRDADRKKAEEDAARSRINQAELYKEALRKQIADTQKYMETLNKLRELGLDDTTYKKLLEKGTAGQAFADSLLASGKDGIAQVNKLDNQLQEVATRIATNAGRGMYSAGIAAAQGLVNGLIQKQNAIREVMERLADHMVRALKKALHIKSPSQVFADIGVFSAKGLALGLDSSSKMVQRASAGLGTDAANALTNSLSDINSKMQNAIDSNPKVTPVLDLTQYQKDAEAMALAGNVVPITAAASYGQASAISQLSLDEAAKLADVQKVNQFKFEQNISSPKALDDIEIYRQTRNQLSQVKSALGINLPMVSV